MTDKEAIEQAAHLYALAVYRAWCRANGIEPKK